MAAVGKGVALWTGICGILLLLCGIGSFIAGGMFTQYNGTLGLLYASGAGFWSGAALILSAILGIATWPVKNKGLLIGFLIITIINILLCAAQCGIATFIVRVLQPGPRCNVKSCDRINLIYGAWMSLAVFSGLGAVFSLAGSIISCVGLCGAGPQSTGTVVVQPGPQQTVSMMTYSHQQAPQQQYPASGVAEVPPAYNDDNQHVTK